MGIKPFVRLIDRQIFISEMLVKGYLMKKPLQIIVICILVDWFRTGIERNLIQDNR